MKRPGRTPRAAPSPPGASPAGTRRAPPPSGTAPARSAGSAGRGWLPTLALALGLALAVTAAHLPVLRAGAIALDDPLFVVHNRLVLHPGVESVRRFFAEVLEPSTVSAYYLPLSMTSLMLDVAAGGSPSHLEPFHATSLALHVMATLFLFLLLRRLCGCAVPAALAALVYGLHPIMVEAIASAGERKTVLASALAFASVWAHVRFAQDGARAWRAASVALFALALLAKPSVLALPLALLALDRWPLRRLSRAVLLEKWPHFLLAAASAVITVLAVQRTWELSEPPPLDLPAMATKACWLLGFYLGKLAWPVELCTVYAPPAPFTLANPAVIAGVAAGIGVSLAAWPLRRSAPALLAGWTLFVLLLAPTFGILRWSTVIAYDRYVHLPSLGLALGLAAGLASLWRSAGRAGAGRRAALALAVLALAGAESAATRGTLAHWRDSLTLWRHAARVSPGVPDSHNGLGATYSELGQSEAAMESFRRAIAVEPNYVDAHQNLGRELTLVGRVPEALPELAFAASHAPRSPGAALQLGFGLQAAGRLDEALTQYRRALVLRAGYLPALRSLGMGLVLSGSPDEGLALLRQGVERSNGDPQEILALATALAQARGPSAEVVRLMNAVIASNPSSVAALNELAWLHATAADPAFRDTAAALRLSERAVALGARPDANSLDTRAAALARAGRFPEAVDVAERAVRLALEFHDDSLARQAGRRLAGYRQRRPFVAPPAPND